MDNDNTHTNDYLSARRPDSISPSTDERRDEDGEQNEDDYKVATTTASSSRSYAISYYPVGRDQGSVSPAYTYTDYYSRMPSAATHSLISQTDQAQRSGHNADIRVQVLPVKLAAILAEPKFAHIITWMPHGRAWKVLRLKEFTKQVAPQYFEYPNYNSFIRLVNAWGFRRIKTGVDANAYFHELFLKDMPNLHKMMKRLHKNQKKTHLNSSLEPDFHRMPYIVSSAAAAVQRRDVGDDKESNAHQNQEHQLEQQRQQEGLDTVASQIQSLQALQQNLNAGQMNSRSSSQSIVSSNNMGALLAALGLAGNGNIFSQPSSIYQQQQQNQQQNQQQQPQKQGLESTQSSALLSNSEAQRLLSLVSSQALQQQVLMNALRDRQQEQLIQQLIQNHLLQSRSFASLNQQQNASREETSLNLLSSLLNSGQGSTSQLFTNNSSALSLLDQIRASDILLQQQRFNSAGTVSGNSSSNCKNIGTQHNS